MSSNTESLLHLLQQYENTTEQKQVPVESVEQPETIKVTEVAQPQQQMELEYCAQSVHYFKHKNCHYRREVDANGIIDWQIVLRYTTHKIEDTYQINMLEKRVSHIVN